MAFIGQGRIPQTLTADAAANYLCELFLHRLRERR
jgi:hypothetical protein